MSVLEIRCFLRRRVEWVVAALPESGISCAQALHSGPGSKQLSWRGPKEPTKKQALYVFPLLEPGTRVADLRKPPPKRTPMEFKEGPAPTACSPEKAPNETKSKTKGPGANRREGYCFVCCFVGGWRLKGLETCSTYSICWLRG